MASREYNERKEIEHRIDRLDRAIRGEQIERSKLFKDFNIAEAKLVKRIQGIKDKTAVEQKNLASTEELLRQVREKRKALGFEHEIVITEHAMLRYCERYLGIDMEKVHQAILKLPNRDITKYGNTIVTVYPLDDDYIPENIE